ncbi:hypothetical protein ACFL6G_09320 [candidate division KSB1 bacterium]
MRNIDHLSSKPTGKSFLVCILLFPVLFLLQEKAFSQTEGIEIFGYYEPQFTGFRVNGEYQQLTSNKLRIDFERSVSDRLTFKANYDFITYSGTTVFYITDYFVEDIISVLPPGSRENYILNFENREFLDNAYMKIAFKKFDLTVGKQQISPGAGYAWNPTDVFNIKSVLDPTYEQPGYNAVRADIPLGNSSTLSMVYSPEEDFEHSGKFLKLKWRAGHFDISALGGERYWNLSDYTNVLFRQERRRTAGFDISGEMFGLGVWSECAYNNMEISENFFEGLIGFDYTFGNGLYLLNEFYRNEQGKTDYREFTLDGWMRNLTSESKALSRDQWYSYLIYPASDLLMIGASAITSLNDGSLAFIPTAIYNFDDNMDITLFGNIYFGTDGKTFSPLLGSGFLLRARYYF